MALERSGVPAAYEPGAGRDRHCACPSSANPAVAGIIRGAPGCRGDHDIAGRRFSAGSLACNDGQVGTRRITQGRAASRSPTDVGRAGMLRQT